VKSGTVIVCTESLLRLFDKPPAIANRIHSEQAEPAARSFYDTLPIDFFCHVLGVMGGWGNQTRRQ
jgi:hypothetical protein